MSLTAEQRKRYDRNIRIPGIGEEGQSRLIRSRVLVVGLGGLGSPATAYLAAAGVGALGLMDSDRVELTNLQRQILHSVPRLGREKTESASETLCLLNPDMRTELLFGRLTEHNAAELIAKYDVVVEASDNFETKFLINDVCLHHKKPFASAGVLGMSGQALFTVPGQSPCLRCAVPEIPRGVPNTDESGILGATSGLLGSLQALEAIRWLLGIWKPRADGKGFLHTVDGDDMRLRTIMIPRRHDCRCASLWNKSTE